MANTRFNYDYARTSKLLQESTGPGKYMLNTPGNGDSMPFIADPQIRLQRWGANLYTNPVDIDSDLMGMTRPLHKHDRMEYKTHRAKNSSANRYNVASAPVTDETRATHPAWAYRDLEQTRWEYPLLDPQEHTCMTFQNNINTRMLEKDNFIPKIPVPWN